MRLATTLLTLILASACAPPPAGGAEPPAFGAGDCAAARAAAFVGRVASPRRLETARRAADARLVRTRRPGEMMTMDYRADRLTVELDAAGTIRAVRCG